MSKEQFLPYKDEYILNLINNNYSMNTVDSYKRDLDIFELFLDVKGKNFSDLNKLLVDEYKGYLRMGQHLLDIDQKVKEDDSKIEILDEHGKNSSDLGKKAEIEALIRHYKKTSSKGSRNGRSKDSGLNSRSVNRMLSALRAYLAYLVDLDFEVPLPPSAIKFIKTEKFEKQVAEFRELVQLIEAPDNFESKMRVKFRNRAILELLFSTGMRISELISLNKNSIKIDKDGVKILDPKLYIIGKGKKQRFVYLTQRSVSFLERYLETRKDAYPALFVPYRGSRKKDPELSMVRLSSRYVQDMISRYKEMLGIVVPTSPHSLRHGFATYLAEQGANPAAIQRLLGHESLQTTTRYVHASDRFAENTHKEFHPLQ